MGQIGHAEPLLAMLAMPLIAAWNPEATLLTILGILEFLVPIESRGQVLGL